jgi:exonuclease III
VKFFVDNNLSPKVARALNCLVEPQHSVIHLKDKFLANATDVDWMRKLAEEQSWIIVSGDVNISRNPHEVRAWKAAGHTIFFLAPGWTHLKSFEQASKLFALFSRIMQLALKAKQGSAFMVPVRGAKIEALT